MRASSPDHYVMNEPRPHEAVTPIQRLVRPFHEFADLEASGGLLLIGCTVAALIWANSPFAGSYFHLWHMDLTFGRIGGLLAKPLHFWINDGLMALFFLLVGLEIKREILVGELASFQRAVLPIAAALGGMIVPAAFYLLFNHGGPGAAGWGMAAKARVAGVKKRARDWKYDVIAMGYPGPVLRGCPKAEPRNLAPGWVGFDFEAAFERPVKIMNDAAMQALGSYNGGTMLF